MRFFVTAGNTQVPIDRVRCITNIFTGRTGARIALEAHRRGHHVTLATSHPDAIEQPKGDRWRCRVYRTFADLETLMASQIADDKPDAIVHCAAVSDYHASGIYAPAGRTFFSETDRAWFDPETSLPTMADRSAGKVKSTEPELWLRLVRAPKLVDKIRSDWHHRGILVKFKLEVGLTEDALVAIAEKSRQDSDADWMVANTLEGAAEWALLGNALGYKKVSRDGLAAALLDVIETQSQESKRG